MRRGEVAGGDQLYEDSPAGSPYEQFGDSCAGRQPQGTGAYCADVFGATPVQSTGTSAATTQPAPVLTTSATSPSGAVDLEAIAEAWRTPELAELKLFAPSSPAFTFFEGLFLVRQFDPFQAWVDPPIEVRGDTLVHAVLGTTIGRFVVDETGLVSDFERNGVAISRTVYRIGLIVEGVDEGEGVTGTVHSGRYFDGNLQVVTLTANNGDVDAVLTAEEFVGENRQIVGVIPETLLRHGITGATVNIFDDAPTSGGTLYGSLWAGGTAVIGWNVDVPALGGPQPAPPTTES